MLGDGLEALIERRSARGHPDSFDALEPFCADVIGSFDVMALAPEFTSGHRELGSVIGVFPADRKDEFGGFAEFVQG